ncbi:MAG: iron ABC transporter ATP-binding protein [Acidimicrobiales bacterium mtb01]|nr:ATP-binding cassette domain-containing protein [Actinomycetota bacterium]TEX45917.1 MAG: iron ABC transporter ATP-binding protein [Acidimicrobiales bacterium mtb01]
MSDDRILRHPGPDALDVDAITFVRDGRTILDQVSLRVGASERWLILGANGSGKTTLVRIAAMYEHPTRGSVSVSGETLGTTDVRELRRRIGYVSASFAMELRGALDPLDVVMTAKNAALEPWWHQYDDADRSRARDCLERMGVGQLAGRTFATLSSGEQQRVLLARSLMNDPAVLLFDEPSARLDLGGREQLVRALGDITRDPTAPPLVLVTHHVDEVPPGMTHVLMLRQGAVLAHGPIDSTLTAPLLSECFDLDLRLERRADGRWTAFAAG